MPKLTSTGWFDIETQRTYCFLLCCSLQNTTLSIPSQILHPNSEEKSQKQEKEIDVYLHQKSLHLTKSSGPVCSHLQLILDIARMVGSTAHSLCAGKSNIAD